MSNWVSYKGKPLGRITLINTRDNSYKLVYVAEDLDSLITLFRLNSDDKVEVESQGEMTFETFRGRHLTNIFSFYPNKDAWLFRNYRARTMDEYTDEYESQNSS